jgi:hypothetical protein
MQQDWAARRLGRSMQRSMPSEAALREQERDLDRQLEVERSLAHDRAAGNEPEVRTMTLAQHSNMLRKGGPLPGEKENRGKISLLPGPEASAAGRRRAPSGAGSVTPSAVPSGRGRPAPSVAGSVAPSDATGVSRMRRPVHFSHMMAREVGSTQIDSVLNPVDGIRGQMRRAGIEPKDHHRENRQMINDLAAARRQQEQERAQQEEEKQRRKAMVRERALQNAHHALEAGGYPQEYPHPASRGASAGRRSVRQPARGSQPPAAAERAHEPGHVPAYLQRRKAEWAATAEEEAARRAAEAECPPGLRLVGPEEKTHILAKLAEERAKAAIELRQLPFVVKTQATQLKKDRLEARLEEIDGAEEAYMKEKVFVPADM